MNQRIFYCKEWSLGYKEPIDLWTEKKARKKHMAGEPYTALIGSDCKPSVFVHVIKKRRFVDVGFLNGELREYLAYGFRLLDDGRLFWSAAILRELAEKEGEGAGILNVSKGVTCYFNEDGIVNVMEEQFIEPTYFKEWQTTFDVSGHYEKFPEFGDYQHLIRIDR